MNNLFSSSTKVQFSVSSVNGLFLSALAGIFLLMTSCTREGSPTAPTQALPNELPLGVLEQMVGDSSVLVMVQNIPTALLLRNRGGIASTCSVSPALPAGLEFARAGNSCALNGAASAMSPSTSYTFTSSNDSGEHTLTQSLMVREATAFFSHVNGELVPASPAAELSLGLPATLNVTNSGFAGTVMSSCQLVVTSDRETDPAALSSFSATVAENGKDCVISGTASAVVEAAADATFTITTTTIADDDAQTVNGQGELVIAITVADNVASCADIELPAPTDNPAFPVPITGGALGMLYVRGNHSSWDPQEEFRLLNKGDNKLQVIALFDNVDAAGDYVSTDTQFKLASDDGSWTTQLWVPQAGTTDIRTSTDGGKLPLEEALPLQRGGAGIDNNWVNLALGSTYSFLVELTDTSDSDGEKGTLTIQRCSPSSPGG